MSLSPPNALTQSLHTTTNSDAIVQGSIYGLSGQFHPRYVGAVMSGNGVAGITVSLLRVVTKAAVSGPNSANLSAILYFSLSAAVILGCILCYAFVLEVRAHHPAKVLLQPPVVTHPV